MAHGIVRAVGERVGAMALGVALTFGIAEVGFRVAGPLFAARQGGADEARVTLLCEGDSFTYGIGGQAYPDQLEALLNARHGPGTVRAINEGIPGLNSALLADHLEEHLARYRPDAVLVIVGENNGWNSIRLDDSGAPTLWSRLDALLLHSRVYKFLRVSTIGWRHGTFHEALGEDHGFEGGDVALQRAANHLTDTREVIGYPEPATAPIEPPEAVAAAYTAGQQAKAEGRYPDAIALFGEVTTAAPDYGPGWYNLATSLMRVKETDTAIDALEHALARPPVEGEVYFTLGYAYAQVGRTDDALRVWRDGLTQWPTSHKLYGALARHLQAEHRLWHTLEVVADVPGIEENLLHRYLLTLRPHVPPGVDDVAAVKELVAEGLRRDVRRIIRTARRYGAEVILGSYPDAAYDAVEEVARAEGVAYIDFRPVYDARFERREDYLSADRCHCNTDGYAVMAEVFADAVEEVLWLP